MPYLNIETREQDGSVEMLLEGELDIASAPTLQRAVARLCEAPTTKALTLDMSALTFIDSTGLAAIVYASRVCERDDCRLDLVRGPRSVAAVFEMTGLAEHLPFRSDGDAIAASESDEDG
jgi:anti-sigma B factor antagonist